VAETRCGGEILLLPPEPAIIALLTPLGIAAFASGIRQLKAAPAASNEDGGGTF